MRNKNYLKKVMYLSINHRRTEIVDILKLTTNFLIVYQESNSTLNVYLNSIVYNLTL